MCRSCFEKLAQNLGVKVEIDSLGLYIGVSSILASITLNVLMEKDTCNLSWEAQKQIIIKRFLTNFPYMGRQEVNNG